MANPLQRIRRELGLTQKQMAERLDKAQQTLEVYRWVSGRRASRPDFGMPLPDLE